LPNGRHRRHRALEFFFFDLFKNKPTQQIEDEQSFEDVQGVVAWLHSALLLSESRCTFECHTYGRNIVHTFGRLAGCNGATAQRTTADVDRIISRIGHACVEWVARVNEHTYTYLLVHAYVNTCIHGLWRSDRMGHVIHMNEPCHTYHRVHISRIGHACVTWIIRVCNMTHLYVYHDSFTT